MTTTTCDRIGLLGAAHLQLLEVVADLRAADEPGGIGDDDIEALIRISDRFAAANNELVEMIADLAGYDLARLASIEPGGADKRAPQRPLAAVREGSTLFLLVLEADEGPGCYTGSRIPSRSHYFARPVVADLGL